MNFHLLITVIRIMHAIQCNNTIVMSLLHNEVLPCDIHGVRHCSQTYNIIMQAQDREYT